MKLKPLLQLFTAVAGVAQLLLAAQRAPAQELFSDRVGSVKVDAVKEAGALEVPYILWGGDVATFYADGGLDTKPGSLFDKQGLKLHLTPGDDFTAQVKNYLSGKSPFLRGTTSMLGQASEVLSADPRTRPIVFLQLTWSAGDHLVSRANCQTLNDLKGKKIALQKFGPHAGMLDDVLRTARLTWKDVTPVWTKDVTGADGPAELFRKDATVDACFAITPDMLALTGGLEKTGGGADGTVKGAHVLVSTVDMKRSIADVYACRKDYYDAHKDVVEKFAAAYLRGCEELVDTRDRANKMEGEAKGRYQQILKMTRDIYGKDVPKDEDADGLIGDAVFVGLSGNKSFFTEQGNLSGFEGKQKAALALADTLGNARKPGAFLKADVDYDRVKVLGGLKVVDKKSGPEDVHLTGQSIVNFTISFAPDQKEFDEDKYGQDFHDALTQASLFGKAVMVVRGHADLANLLQEFVKAGLQKGLLRREGNSGNYTYYWNGEKLDLSDTKKVVELIEKTDFDGVAADPRLTLKELQRLSDERAVAVKNAVMKHAKLRGILVDPKQFQAKGVGVLEPAVKQPRKAEEMARNRRVEFRVERQVIESSGGTLDY
jgi:ABC-type nitrate/sulfonate/bicarbonate transport system substrate-binding protein